MHKRERGAAAVEFALILIPLLLLVLGLFEFGRIYMVQLTLTNAARDAARMFAVSETSVRDDNTSLTLANALRLSSGGSAATASTAVDTYLDSSPSIDHSCDEATPESPGEVTVTLVRTENILGFLTGDENPLVPIEITGKAVMVCGA